MERELKGGLNKMESIFKKAQDYAMRKSLIKQDKRGVMGLDTAKSFLLVLLGLVVIGVVFMIVITQLGNTSIVSSDAPTQAIVTNATLGAADFFSNTGTWLSLLSVVILILIIAAVIMVVNRFGSGGRSL